MLTVRDLSYLDIKAICIYIYIFSSADRFSRAPLKAESEQRESHARQTWRWIVWEQRSLAPLIHNAQHHRQKIA